MIKVNGNKKVKELKYFSGNRFVDIKEGKIFKGGKWTTFFKKNTGKLTFTTKRIYEIYPFADLEYTYLYLDGHPTYEGPTFNFYWWDATRAEQIFVHSQIFTLESKLFPNKKFWYSEEEKLFYTICGNVINIGEGGDNIERYNMYYTKEI